MAPSLTSSRRLIPRRKLVTARHLLLLLAALSIVVFAVFALRPPTEGTAVVVSKADLAANEPVVRSQLRVLTLPGEAVPLGTVGDVAAALDQRPPQFVPAGTVLTQSLLGIGDTTARIPPGYATTVLSLDPGSVFMEAGDVVEVWGTVMDCGVDPCPITRLADDVTVLSISEPPSNSFSGENPTLVTLSLKASDVGPVLQSAASGSIHFVLG